MSAVAKQAFSAHLEIASAERRHFYRNNDLAETNPEHCSMIIDGMTQNTTALPHFDRTVKSMDKHQVDVHCVGSIITGVGSFLEFSYANISNDANLLIDTLHRNIRRVQDHRHRNNLPLPSVLHVQLDNCNTNKSKALMAYACHLVKTKVFRRVEVNFMLVGHTHENIDQLFSRFSVKLRTVKAFTLEDMMQVARDAFHKNKPECIHVTAVNDWNEFLKGSVGFTDFEKLKPQHVFEVKRDEENSNRVLLRAKLFSTRVCFKPDAGIEVLQGEPLEGQPETVECESLNSEKREALEECVRNLCSLLGEAEFSGDIKEFWEGLIKFQDNIDEGIFDEATCPVLEKCSPPALDLTPAEVDDQAMLNYLGDELRETVYPTEVQLCETHNATMARENLVNTILDNNEYEVTFEQMSVGSMALCLAPETDKKSPFAFTLKMPDGTLSRLVTLNRVLQRDEQARKIQWAYLAPSRWVSAKDRLVGKNLATQPGFFTQKVTKTTPFYQDEIILSWDVEDESEENSIPLAQQKTALLIFEAMARAAGTSTSNCSDDSDVGENGDAIDQDRCGDEDSDSEDDNIPLRTLATTIRDTNRGNR